jgi:hypothetical protein
VASQGWLTGIIVFAIFSSWALLGGICWWFWKHRSDD